MLRYDYSNLIDSEMIKGITLEQIDSSREICNLSHSSIISRKNKDCLGFYQLPDKNIKLIKEYIDKTQQDFDALVILGIGGSALGNKALYNALRIEKQLTKKLYILDNVDPDLLREILDSINIKRTLFNIITKSGTTAETMATFLIIMDMLKKEIPEGFLKNVVITTDREKGFLRQLILKEGYQDFIVPDNVGGRFSVLTDVGLVSSAFAGIDIDALLSGAAEMRILCEKNDIFKNPAYLNGLFHFLYMKQQKNISVMMPYSNSLYDIADWYRQLWAESLGKRYSTSNKEIFVGQTPIKALGTTDQHSQVQLYTEGPNDKVFTFIKVEHFNHDYIIPHLYNDRSEVNYLAGKKLSELLNAELLATELALTKSGRPNCTITLPHIDEYNIGALIFMYEVQTVFTGSLLGIDPLDQPGVEAGKIATYALMGKTGFEKEAVEINTYLARKENEGHLI